MFKADSVIKSNNGIKNKKNGTRVSAMSAYANNNLLNFLSSYIFEVVATLFSRSLAEGFNENYSNKEKLILFVIVGPILETLLFQYAVIEFCKRKRIALKYCCFLSAFIFASMHLYNIFYFLYAFVGGLMFAYLYIIGRNKKNAILITAATHIIYNGIILIARVYFP